MSFELRTRMLDPRQTVQVSDDFENRQELSQTLPEIREQEPVGNLLKLLRVDVLLLKILKILQRMVHLKVQESILVRTHRVKILHQGSLPSLFQPIFYLLQQEEKRGR